VYPSVGYKLAAWRDVSWWHLRLAELPPEPPPPRSFPEISMSEEVAGILEAACGNRSFQVR
jgi:hypothetical protein